MAFGPRHGTSWVTAICGTCWPTQHTTVFLLGLWSSSQLLVLQTRGHCRKEHLREVGGRISLALTLGGQQKIVAAVFLLSLLNFAFSGHHTSGCTQVSDCEIWSNATEDLKMPTLPLLPCRFPICKAPDSPILQSQTNSSTGHVEAGEHGGDQFRTLP